MHVVIANWKMYLSAEEAELYAENLLAQIETMPTSVVALCPPVLAIPRVGDIIRGSEFSLGAQDAFWETDGAHTGEISAEDLKAAGCEYVLVGHSERRQQEGETNEMVHNKLLAVLNAGMTPVLLVGETYEQYEAKETKAVVEKQLKAALEGVSLADSQKVLIGYEPIWAIAPSEYEAKPEEIAPVVEHIHSIVKETIDESHYEVLYGGSVNSSNIESFLAVPGITGVVPGSASTKLDEFGKMLAALAEIE